MSGFHDLIGSMCNPYTHNLMTSKDMNTCCHSNLVCAAVGDGLEERDMFMCTGFTCDTSQYFAKPSPVEVGDILSSSRRLTCWSASRCAPRVT